MTEFTYPCLVFQISMNVPVIPATMVHVITRPTIIRAAVMLAGKAPGVTRVSKQGQ